MIKKSFILTIGTFIVLTLINFHTSYARQIRFADVGVEKFSIQLKQTLVSPEARQYLGSLGYPDVTITNVTRERNFDNPSKGLSTWSCYFNMADVRQGQIILVSDIDGYVFEVCVACYKSKLSAAAGAAIMWCINVMTMGLTEGEANLLGETWNTWSVSKNRRFVISRDIDNNGIFMIYRAYDN